MVEELPSGPELKMDAQNLHRLKEEQDKALAAADSKLQQWNKFHADYVALDERLKMLPDKVSHDVMVPFGSLAFMPGHLVHTNEILVLLGDNYFVERSAKQARDILSRRLKNVEEKMVELKKERDLLAPRADFTSEMIEMAEGRREEQEIIEPFNEEEEKAWRERHREYLRRAGEQRQKDKAAEIVAEEEEVPALTQTDKELWERLDQLERQERLEDELELISHDEESEMSDASSSSSGETADDEDTADDRSKTICRVITFSHTKLLEKDVSQQQGMAEKEEKEEPMFRSPADIYSMVQPGPRSILKTSTSDGLAERRASLGEKSVQFSVDVGEEVKKKKGERANAKDAIRIVQKMQEKAFKDTVVEREMLSLAPFPTGEPIPTASDDAENHPGSMDNSSQRPASKFKAARQKDSVPLSESDVTVMNQNSSVPTASQTSSSRPMSKFRASRQKQGGAS